MNKRSLYISSAIIGTLSVIVAGALDVPAKITGDLNNEFLNMFILLVIMSICVSVFVFLKNRTAERKELVRTMAFACLWSLVTTVGLVIVFSLVFLVLWRS